jgi:hypothetical protein
MNGPEERDNFTNLLDLLNNLPEAQRRAVAEMGINVLANGDPTIIANLGNTFGLNCSLLSETGLSLVQKT